MPLTALVVNPHAGHDVRRITSLARAVGGHDRVNITARVLAGLAAAGCGDIAYVPEPSGSVPRALEMLQTADPRARGLRVRPVAVPGGGARDAAGTAAGAAALRTAGASCIVTVGGDGTNRAVVIGWPDAVLVPVAGGTNTAMAIQVDPSAAGLAAGRFAADPRLLRSHVTRHSWLTVDAADGDSRIALADVALTRHRWVGAHALWHPEALVEIVLARSDPTVSGLAGLGGMLHPLTDGVGLHIVTGSPGRLVRAPLGPGRFEPVQVRRCRVVAAGEPVQLSSREDLAATIAFDGERELVLRPGESVTVTLRRAGPRILDVASVLRATSATCERA